FDVATAAVQLELALRRVVLGVAAALDDWQVGLKKAGADRVGEIEADVESGCVEIVVEDAADAAAFVAVLEEEVLVAPALVLGIGIGTQGVADGFRGAMPVHGVFVEGIERREV